MLCCIISFSIALFVTLDIGKYESSFFADLIFQPIKSLPIPKEQAKLGVSVPLFLLSVIYAPTCMAITGCICLYVVYFRLTGAGCSAHISLYMSFIFFSLAAIFNVILCLKISESEAAVL